MTHSTSALTHFVGSAQKKIAPFFWMKHVEAHGMHELLYASSKKKSVHKRLHADRLVGCNGSDPLVGFLLQLKIAPFVWMKHIEAHCLHGWVRPVGRLPLTIT